MEVFWERGYEGASISQLAQAMQINPPSLYAAFKSKEDLFLEAVALYRTLEDAGERALRDAPTARAAVEAMLRANVDVYTDPDKPNGCLVVLGATTWTPANASVRDHLAGHRQQIFEGIRRRLQHGVAAQELPPDTDVDALAAFYHTVLEGLSIQARDGATRKTMYATIDRAMASWPGRQPGNGSR